MIFPMEHETVSSDQTAGSASTLVPEPPSEEIFEDEDELYDITIAGEEPWHLYDLSYGT